MNRIDAPKPPIIIDIGAESIKYTQPFLNLSKFSKEITRAKDERKKEAKRKTNQNKERKEDDGVAGSSRNDSENDKKDGVDEEEEEIINSNTIFDNKRNIKKISIKNFLDENGNTAKFNFSYSGEDQDGQNTDCIKFGNEIYYDGIINDFEKWQSVIEQIGRNELGNSYFNQERFKDTPLIICQDSLPLKKSHLQISEMYERLFENLAPQSVLLCSSAMVNLLSHNLSDGIVVDIGESRTCFTPIRNGFTLYNKALRSNFLSGRTMTALLKYFGIGKNDQRNNDEDAKRSITYEEYKNFLKEKNGKYTMKCLYGNDKNSNQGQKKIGWENYLGYLFTFPELFRSVFRLEENEENISKENLETFLNTFYKEGKTDEIFVRVDNKAVNYSDWSKNCLNYYGKKWSEKNSLEKTINENKSEDNIIPDELERFRRFSISHIVSHLHNSLINDLNDCSMYNHIVFSGGVLNTVGLRERLTEDINILFKKGKMMDLRFPEIKDCSCSIYKGANYLSKLDGLENIVITKKDYLEYGKDYLCYNYI